MSSSLRPLVTRCLTTRLPLASRLYAPTILSARSLRSFSTTPRSHKDENNITGTPEMIEPDGQTSGGGFSRTDPSIKVEFEDGDFSATTKPVKGRGGKKFFKKTLASFSLEGKTVVVTGAARGLGLVMAQACVESGADLAIIDLSKSDAQKAADDLLKHFKDSLDEGETVPKITAHGCNVADKAAVDSAFADIISQHGTFDVLVTAAGFVENFRAEEYPLDRMQKLWGVNVDGTYLCCVAAGRHWIETGQKDKSIVMIGSMSGVVVNVPQPQAPYNASKAAVRSLAQSFAVEWAGHGIRVNSISPGYMLTALTQKILDDNPALKNQWLSLIPVGKMGNPVDLMGIVVYLASEAASYTTGADFRIDGGYTCT